MPESLPPTQQKPSETAITTEERRSNRQKRIQATLKWLGFPSSGFGLAGVGYFLHVGQPFAAILAGLASIGVLVIALAAKFFAELGNKVLDRIEERLEERTDPLADWIVASLEGGFVGLWWKLTPQFKGAYYQSLIYAYEAFETRGLKTPGPVTPDLEKVFVPLRVQTNSLGKISSALIQSREAGSGLRIWDLLVAGRKEDIYRRLVILGAPGSGKTTLLKHLTLTYARNKQRKKHPKAPKLIPVLLLLHQVREQILAENSPPLPVLIAEQVKKQPSGRKLKAVPRWFEERLLQGKCLVMLDGLDEVADEAQRKVVSAWVDEQMQTYPETNWIMTSRPFGYEKARLKEARTTLEVLSFSLDQMELFLRRWYVQNEMLRRARKLDPGVKAEAERKSSDLIGRIKNSPPLAAMALNPLLLTMIATVHDNRGALPGNRVELYDEICDVLLARRREAKGVQEDFPLNAGQKQSVLQGIAFMLMKGNTRWFTLPGADGKLPYLELVAGDNLTAQEFVDHIQKVCGLFVEQSLGRYQFAHLSFQEYLAARQIQDRNLDSQLCEKINQSWWHETIRLYAATNDTTALIEAALKRPTVESLTIAYDCRDEGQSLNPGTRRRLEQIGLNSADPEIAKLAAEVMLKRRLARLTRIDDECSIDSGYISRAEYQLFLNEWMSGADCEAESGLVLPDAPMDAVTGLSLRQATTFCHWLSERSNDGGGALHFYRLPLASELERVGVKGGSRLEPLQIKTAKGGDPRQGLRVLKVTVPRLYRSLLEHLLLVPFEDAWQWKLCRSFDQFTNEILLGLAQRTEIGFLDVTSIQALPGRDLALLDQLWFYFSQGSLGFGRQVDIWETLPGTVENRKSSLPEILGWRKEQASSRRVEGQYPQLCYDALPKDSPYDLFVAMARKVRESQLESLPMTSFEVVKLDVRGREQQRWQQRNLVLREMLPGDCLLELVRIPEQSFVMGSPKDELGHQEYEAPQHEVTLPGCFMGRYPITQRQWRIVAAMPQVEVELKPDPSHFKGEDRPVEKVSWEDAQEFCERLSRHTGRPYRLPTEAEWECACRSGTKTPFYFGETITTDVANYDGKTVGGYGQGPKGRYRKTTVPAGSLGVANEFGLSDMHGNVWEWCQDHYLGSYEGAPGDGSAWIDQEASEGKERVLRGGSWYINPVFCRSANRSSDSPSNANFNFGFRVVCGVARL